ncbi:putative glutathione S-transferase 6 [Diplonema papillatum]|nr:putative glutathione S-transferase 6 [Diplonema papillatum]KAJ9451822.1 putative glutathione S-transferase 6 [Diplonema papillatum]
MPQLKVTYFASSGRAEPTRLALAVGGMEFEDSIITHETWGGMKPKFAPVQLPLLEVDGKPHSQSIALCRYACKLAKVDGKPLYPEDPYEALLVDELVDKVSDAMNPFMPTFDITDPTERHAKRAEVMVKGGPVEKWAAHVDSVLGTSSSGFALLDRLTMADLLIFLYLGLYRSGVIDGVSKDCFDHLKHICKHRDKIANLRQVKNYYKDNESPAYAYFKA